MSDRPTRLYGLPQSETLYPDPDTIIEQLRDDGITGTFTIEEWTVCETIDLLPNTDWILEHVIEMADPVTEDWWDTAENALGDPEVQGAFDAALGLLASKIRYWMADRKVGETVVEVSDDE